MEDDIENDIANAIAELGGDTAAAPAPVPDPVAIEATPKPEAAPVEDGRVRNPDGTFAPKGKPPKVQAKAPAAPVEATSAPEPDAKGDQLAPPRHWSAEAKAEFLNAPRALQQQALKREEEIEKARQEWSGKAEDYNRINKVIAPHVDAWAREGLNPDMAIARLIAAHTSIQKNPMEGFSYILDQFARGQEPQVLNALAARYGYALTQATNQGYADQGADYSALQADPTVRRLWEENQYLAQKLNQIENRFTEEDTAKNHAQMQAAQSEISAFQSDPKNVYFDNVRPMLIALVKMQDEKGDARPIKERLQEAYDQACYADPTVRTLVLTAQAKEAQAKAAADAKAKADAARKASVSVTGSPGVGRAVPVGQNAATNRVRPKDDIEDDVRAAFAELSRA